MTTIQTSPSNTSVSLNQPVNNTINLHRIPLELQERPQWCVAGASKAPQYFADGRLKNASSTEPLTWHTFNQVMQIAFDHRDHISTHVTKKGRTITQKGLNIGYILNKGDPFSCIDLDVKDEGTDPNDPDIWSEKELLAIYDTIVHIFDSYTEFSKNGKGLHIWIKGKIDKGVKKSGVEIYPHTRFIICTGNIHKDKPIQERQSILDGVMQDIGQTTTDNFDPVESQPQREEDESIITKAKNATNGEKFLKLWNGNWETVLNSLGKNYPSQSEADFALMGMLVFYSPNNEQVKRLFLESGLGKREKATDPRNKYVDNTITKVRRHKEVIGLEVMVKKMLDDHSKEQRLHFKQIGQDGDLDEKDVYPPSMTLNDMLENLIHITSEKEMVAFRHLPSRSKPAHSVAAKLAHNKMDVQNPKTGKIESVPTYRVWATQKNRLVVDTVTFDPRRTEFCYTPYGELALNTWRRRPNNAPEDWRDRIAPFLDHVTYLIPKENERERFLKWFAHIEQEPGVLPHNHYLMIATQQGVGRNWLSGLAAYIWSGHVALSYNLRTSLDTGFNGLLSERLLAVVDEVNEGGTKERWKHTEELKKMVTEPERDINKKYNLQHKELNCCRWLLFSNYETALPLTDQDRRWNVIRNPSEPRNEKYYLNLYDTLRDSQFISSVREFLITLSLADFNPGARAMYNEAKDAVFSYSKSIEDEKAEELVASHPRDLIFSNHLFQAIYDVDPENTFLDIGRKWKLLGPIARSAGIEPVARCKDLMLFGKRGHKVWVLRNPQKWKEAKSLAIEQELCRTN